MADIEGDHPQMGDKTRIPSRSTRLHLWESQQQDTTEQYGGAHQIDDVAEVVPKRPHRMDERAHHGIGVINTDRPNGVLNPGELVCLKVRLGPVQNPVIVLLIEVA